jgi:hypothetical protein
MMRFPYKRVGRPSPSISLNGRLDQPRPIIPVTLIGPSNSRLRTAHIDTASDESFFPEDVAIYIGIDLSNAPVESFKGMGGGRMVGRFAQVNVRMSDGIKFHEWPAWIGFVAKGLLRPVLGFGGFLNFFTATFRGDAEIVELVTNRLYPGT